MTITRILLAAIGAILLTTGCCSAMFSLLFSGWGRSLKFFIIGIVSIIIGAIMVYQEAKRRSDAILEELFKNPTRNK